MRTEEGRERLEGGRRRGKRRSKKSHADRSDLVVYVIEEVLQLVVPSVAGMGPDPSDEDALKEEGMFRGEGVGQTSVWKRGESEGEQLGRDKCCGSGLDRM